MRGPIPPHRQTLDGMRNLFYVTAMPGAAMPLLEKGINPIGKAGQNDGSKPAILISSSPHKTGSHETPWQDVFNPDFGHVRYFGDNKKAGSDPAQAPGNRLLLEQFRIQNSPEEKVRSRATPLFSFSESPRDTCDSKGLES